MLMTEAIPIKPMANAKKEMTKDEFSIILNWLYSFTKFCVVFTSISLSNAEIFFMISSIALGESQETKIKEADRLKSFPASSIFITTPPSSKPISLL